MGRGVFWAGLLAVAAGTLAVGCSRSTVRRNDPPDPLLMSKTPVQSKYAEAQPVAVRTEPVPPPMPANVVEPTSLAVAPSAIPASRTRQIERATLMSRSRDYRHVQGVLERSAGNQWLLCYEEVSRDAHGGKLLLAADPRLEKFHSGDVVRVAGSLIVEQAPRSGRAWVPHPDYRIQSIELIQAGR